MTTAGWEPLETGDFKMDSQEAGVDPMWVWADATHYRDHGIEYLGSHSGVWAAVERKDISEDDAPRYLSRHFTPAQWSAQRPTFARAELSLPVVPERPARQRETHVPTGAGAVPRSTSEVLIGVIDSGCPFASRILGRGAGTRVLSLWDQDPVQPAFGHCGGHRPAPYGYGCAIDRAALDRLIATCTTPAGIVDEDAVYSDAGYDIMRWRFSHGAAVLSQLFAPSIHGGPLQPRPGTPPPWDADTGPIDKADLVFVDLSSASLQDGTSAAIARNVIDGLQFIVDHAGPATRRIIINISIGSARTLHDGSSIVEGAMAEMIDRVERSDRELWIAVPMGNDNMAQSFGVLSRPGERLELYLPPDCEMPQYVTVRWPPGTEAAGAGLRITPPGGEAHSIGRGEAFGWPCAQLPQCGVISSKPLIDNGPASSLIAFAPTSSPDPQRAVARAGRWRIELELADGVPMLAEPACFWISPNSRNPGALPRSRDALFVDWNEAFQPRRYLRVRYDDPEGELPTDGLRHSGSLSGMATLQRRHPRFVAVGGYVVLADKKAATPYSSGGPAAGNAGSRRRGPDVSAPADSSPALRGLVVHGSRSGSTVRVVGTSFAVPLAVRAIANCGDLPVPKDSDVTPRRGPYLGDC